MALQPATKRRRCARIQAVDAPFELRGHVGYIIQMTFSHDSDYLFSAAYEDKVGVWNVQERCLVGWLEHSERRAVYCIAVSPKPDVVVTGHDKIVVWDMKTMTKMTELDGPRGVWALRFDQEGALLASGHDSGTVVLRRTEGEWPILHMRKMHSDRVNAFSFVVQNSQLYLLSASVDSFIKLTEVTSGRTTCTFEGHNRDASVSFVEYSPLHGIYSAASDGSIIKWNIEGSIMKRVNKTHDEQKVFSLCIHKSLLASKGFEGTIKIWALPDIDLIKTITQNTGCGDGLSFHPSGNWLVGTENEIIRVWKI